MSSDDVDMFKVNVADEKALDWCSKNPGWQRICDVDCEIKCSFDEIPAHEQRYWNAKNRGGKEGWEEWGQAYYRFPVGYVDGAGNFFGSCEELPPSRNFMTVVCTGKPRRTKFK